MLLLLLLLLLLCSYRYACLCLHRGEREREEVFAVFAKFCVKCFAKKSEEGQDKRSRPASLSVEEEKPKKKREKSIAGFVNLQNRYA